MRPWLLWFVCGLAPLLGQLPQAAETIPSVSPETPSGKRLQVLGWVDLLYHDSNRTGTASFFDIGHAYLSLNVRFAKFWRGFFEAEYEHNPNITGGNTETEILLERAYLEYRQSSLARFRLGKFNTPAGIWKPLHWNIAVDTIQLPIMEDNVYIPIKSTGLEFFGTKVFPTGELNYAALFSDVSEDVASVNTLDDARALGGDLNYFHRDRIRLGFSYYYYRDLRGRETTATGFLPYFDIYLIPNHLLLRGEYLSLKREVRDVEVFYAKIKYQINQRHYLNYRYDRGNDERRAAGLDQVIQTLTYGFWPRRELRLKFEVSQNRILGTSDSSFEQWAVWVGYIFR